MVLPLHVHRPDAQRTPFQATEAPINPWRSSHGLHSLGQRVGRGNERSYLVSDFYFLMREKLAIEVDV